MQADAHDATGRRHESSAPTDAAHARARAVQEHYAPAESRALGAVALLAALGIFWVVLPLGIGVLLGALFAVTTYRPYQRLVRHTGRPASMALALTSAVSTFVAGALGILSYLLALQGVAVAATLPRALAAGGPASKMLERLVAPFAVFGIAPGDLVERVRGAAGGIAASLAGWAAQLVGMVFDGALTLFFVAMTMFFVLTRWSELERRAQRMMPLNPNHTRRLMRELLRIGRQTVIGNFGTAIVQGTVAGLGYALAGVPQPVFFGAITAVAALLPVFGSLLVWVPAGVILFVEGRHGAGLFELVWGAVAVVGLCDYFVRPKLVGRGEAMSTWMTFVSLFGGIKLFGFVGFLLGPLIAGISVAALRVYERTRRFRLGLS